MPRGNPLHNPPDLATPGRTTPVTARTHDLRIAVVKGCLLGDILCDTPRSAVGEARAAAASAPSWSRIGPMRAAADHLPGNPRGFRVEMRASLLAGCGGTGENRRDVLDLVKLARGDLHDQIVGLLVSERQPAAVEPVEGDHRCQPEPFVPV